MIVDCHVNVYEDKQILPLHLEVTRFARAEAVELPSNPAIVESAMRDVDRAIVFSLRYKDSIGIDGDDEVTARLVARNPKKFIGFACLDPRMPDCMDLLVHAVEDLKLKGVKFGPIYNGVSLLDPRLEPVYQYLVRHNLPLTMHMGTTYGANAPIQYGRPLDVDTIANRNKIFWGTDFPFTTVADSIDGLKNVNKVIAGSGLPRVTQDTIDQILHSNPMAHWWHGGLAT